MLKNSLIVVMVFALGAAGAARADAWAPWSTSTDAPVLLTPADKEPPSRRQTARTEYSVAATPFIWLLKLYRNYISPLDGDRCPMYPTCSQYSVQAIHEHGPVVGIIMTADRLIHESDERDYAFTIKMGNRYRYADPLENNDFWWYKK
jgi:putative membrane protein insertion efficiency factor